MDSDSLDNFLREVRKARLVDYLDPVGETAVQAFERRLKWARVNQWDPRSRVEAKFLVDHASALRGALERGEALALTTPTPAPLPEPDTDEPQVCVVCSAELQGRVAYFGPVGWLCRDCALGR